MQTFHEARVEPADIDELGHMNVRVYARHAAAAVHKLLAAMGLDADALAAQQALVFQPDCHTLFRREQLLGNPLGVRAGVLAVQPDCIDTYLELHNRDSDQLAATFRKEVRLVARADLAPLAFAQGVCDGAEKLAIEWPAHGKPRSLPLDPVRRDLTVADMQREGVVSRFQGYEVTAELSTPDGFMDLSGAPWFSYSAEPVPREPAAADAEDAWFSSDSHMAVATLESRHSVVDIPRTGEIVVTYTAIIDVGRKIMRFAHWSFDEKSGRLLAILNEVGIGLNLQTRRSCEFPPETRAKLMAQCHPALG